MALPVANTKENYTVFFIREIFTSSYPTLPEEASIALRAHAWRATANPYEDGLPNTLFDYFQDSQRAMVLAKPLYTFKLRIIYFQLMVREHSVSQKFFVDKNL